MKVLVFGSRGWIGTQFTALLDAATDVEWVQAESRADDVEAVRREIDTSDPTHVISLIGRTHGPGASTIDYLEGDGKLRENVRDNLFSPVVLALVCRDAGVHFTYLGTGCIFDSGSADPSSMRAFKELDMPNYFGSSYSTVKGFTDRLMPLLGDHVLNLRIRMPITGKRHSRNFITKITTYERICSMPNSMSVMPELLPAALDLMRRSYVGTLNFTNPGTISHNEILELYRDIVDPTFKWSNFSLEDQDQLLASGRSNNMLDTGKLSEACPEIRPIREAVEACLRAYA